MEHHPHHENQFEQPVPIEVQIEESTSEKIKETEIERETFSTQEYQERNARVNTSIEEVKSKKDNLSQQLAEVRSDLYGEVVEPAEKDPSIIVIEQELKSLEQEKIKAAANYPGDWTLLLRDRMLDPITKEKFIETRQESMGEMNFGEVGKFDKPKTFVAHYQQQIDEYDASVQRIFSSTQYAPAKEFNKTSGSLGKGEIGWEGAVYTDAISGDKMLNTREKNIIEAHEKGHGLRDFTSKIDQGDFKASVDIDVLRTLEAQSIATGESKRFVNYIMQPDEIAERMAQLKNYFGMDARAQFTPKHLEYARQHYLSDVGLDNNMTPFFAAITEQTQAQFIKTINKYPL